jgi:Trk-type K+ transport system membrane component
LQLQVLTASYKWINKKFATDFFLSFFVSLFLSCLPYSLLLLIPKADERQKKDKMLATTTTTTHEWCRWVVVDFVCVFPSSENCKQTDHIDCKGSNFTGTSGWKYIGSS